MKLLMWLRDRWGSFTDGSPMWSRWCYCKNRRYLGVPVGKGNTMCPCGRLYSGDDLVCRILRFKTA